MLAYEGTYLARLADYSLARRLFDGIGLERPIVIQRLRGLKREVERKDR